MKHGTITKPEATRWLPEFPEMRRLFDGLPTFFSGFDAMKLEELMDGDTYVVRAELPGIDPEKDADVWVADGMLHMKAERTLDEKTEKDGTFRSRVQLRRVPPGSGAAQGSGRRRCDGHIQGRRAGSAPAGAADHHTHGEGADQQELTDGARTGAPLARRPGGAWRLGVSRQ